MSIEVRSNGIDGDQLSPVGRTSAPVFQQGPQRVGAADQADKPPFPQNRKPSVGVCQKPFRRRDDIKLLVKRLDGG
jgi:hypothetical protein